MGGSPILVTDSIIGILGELDIRNWFRTRFPGGTSAKELRAALVQDGWGDYVIKLCAVDCRLAHALLGCGVSVNAECSGGWTPLRHAVSSDRRDVAECLISHGAAVDVFMAAGLGLTDMLGDMLKMSLTVVNSVDNSGYVPLHWAAWKKKKDCLELLVSHGADVNARNPKFYETPLHLAVNECWEEGVRLLLASGANANEKDFLGHSALHHAASNDSVILARMLVASGANVDDARNDGQTPLHCAASDGAVHVARVLIEAGAAINARSNVGRTPLGEARFPWWEEFALARESLFPSGGVEEKKQDEVISLLRMRGGIE